MRTFLMIGTAGKYGGAWFKNSLRLLDRYIDSELEKGGFKSSFNEFWLTLYYPPLFVLPGVLGIEKGFMTFYETLPKSRLNRKGGKVDIQLQAPEFSECFDKEEQIKYSNTFEIEDKYKNIKDVDLAKILIDKYLTAGQIITSKLKKEDSFDFNQFSNVLNRIKNSLSEEFLASMSITQAKVVEQKTENRAVTLRKERASVNRPKDKLIRDLRVYYTGLPIKALYPYDYQYAEIFLNILRRKELRCPTYHHLYIQVGKTLDEALARSIAMEDWHVYGIAAVDFENYLKATEKEKEKIVFDIICDGLKDIAKIDSLDMNLIEEAIQEIQLMGLNTELSFKQLENDKYKLDVTYISETMENECPVFLTITDKLNGKSSKKMIGRAEHSQLFFWLQKITMNNKSIKIKSSDSIRGDVWLKEKPRQMEFPISELLQ